MNISQLQELNVELQQIKQIKCFWCHLKEENGIFQTKKKLVKLDQKKESYNEIEFIIEFCIFIECCMTKSRVTRVVYTSLTIKL